MNLSSIVKESKAVQGKSFAETVEKAIDLLSGERGRIGNITISERLAKLEPAGHGVVIGDLHGDLESLVKILESSQLVRKMTKNKDVTLIFLGDYGDRGVNSAEVYYVVLRLKLTFPEQVLLLRGNHEGPADLQASPHDLPTQFLHRFGKSGANVYAKTRELFDYLYNAVLVEERYLMVHGGLPPEIITPQDLAHAHMVHPQKDFLEDLLWGDPSDMVQEVLRSQRGAGKLFGKSVTEKVLRRLGVKLLIRGHEPCADGFKLNHNGKVLTLFSRKGSPYFNAYGAYLQLPLSEKFDSVKQLMSWIHKF